MSAINTRTKKAWEESQKKGTLKALELLMKKIKSDKIKVVSYELSPGVMGGTTFSVYFKHDNS